MLRYGLIALVLTSGFGTVVPAFAHPHVFVDARTGFQLDSEGRLIALSITWTYDAFTSLTLFDILDLDKDGDGELDDNDRANIVAGETDWDQGYDGDTYLEQGGVAVVMGSPENGAAWFRDNRISVRFDLPLAVPLLIESEIVLRLYDPTYYYAYTVVGTDGAVPSGCESGVVPFQADRATAELQEKLALLTREETPSIDNVGRLFSDEVWLRCG